MAKEKICSLEKVKHTVKSIDMYGSPIQLNVAGEDSVKTYLGTLCTLFTYLIIGAYSVNLFIIFVTRANPNVAMNIVEN